MNPFSNLVKVSAWFARVTRDSSNIGPYPMNNFTYQQRRAQLSSSSRVQRKPRRCCCYMEAQQTRRCRWEMSVSLPWLSAPIAPTCTNCRYVGQVNFRRSRSLPLYGFAGYELIA